MAHKREMKDMIKTINLHAKSYAGGKGINPRVLYAIEQVPRHNFVAHFPYGDGPVRIGHGQTISQPFIVAYMTDILELQPLHKVLEIGMGSGYQAAVLSELSHEIYTVERIPELAEQTKTLLERLEYNNIKIKVGNGYEGWKEHAPYDRIIVTATADELIPPQALVDQLVEGGKMILPIKRPAGNEELILITKTGKTYTEKSLIGVRFVPLVNEV
jgi:protein-L-isoaspartate(D-aspartate) O-methyltransferase|tara:strand:- start:1781 stop:2425 length:645 start_codon:yes stop_codon:yes gene_type:complete